MGECSILFADRSAAGVAGPVGASLARRTGGANAAGAVLAAVSGALTSEGIKGETGFGTTDVIALAVYFTLSAAACGSVGCRWYATAARWADRGDDPDDRQKSLLVQLPLREAALSMVAWLGAVAVWSGIDAFNHPAGYVVRVSLSILLGGITTSALVYMLAEWTLRPLVARALATGAPPCPVSPGVGLKLVASWAVGADVFLLMIGLTFLGRPSGSPPRPAAVWFIVGAGLLAGTLVCYVATKSLVVPLRALRTAIRQVEAGFLDVSVPVDDAGEVGMLQAGFNHMVAGLRERNALQDLFGRHVGEDVARRAMEMGVTLGGERREVAVLFVDLVGSTEFSLRHSPDQVVELLNRFFSAVVKVVGSEGGWVNKFEGDGALCVFGAPISVGDHADRALRAARTIRSELLALAAMHPELDAAIGVSAGAVVAGNVGSEQRYEYTVIGTPVNRAARLTDEAKRRLSRVLAGQEVVDRAAKEASSWTVADEILLRGLTEPVLVYEPAVDRTSARMRAVPF